MIKPQHRAIAQFCKKSLLDNFKLLESKVPGVGLIPMVKANAYGHGAHWAADTLKQQKSVYSFGVASFNEGIKLRESLRTSKTPIIVFSDCAPWSDAKHTLCLRDQLLPVFSEASSLLHFYKECSRKKREVHYHLEFNTGMNRLGLDFAIKNDLLRWAKKHPPSSIFTHMAEAELPHSALSKLQMKNFEEICKWSQKHFPKAHLHFANSASIWNASQYGLSKQMTLARPGLSLYGVRPFESAPEGKVKLKRVMTFNAPVINLLHLKKGDRVGYGGTYQCKAVSGENIAVIAAGYADGVFRSLGNQGVVVHQSNILSILGRVSMDLTAVCASPKLKMGDRVEFWGENIDPYAQALAAGTNPYELMTRIGERVERVYE